MADIQTIVIVGAGTMGHGIAAQSARCGLQAILTDVDQGRVDAGISSVHASWEKAVAKGKLDDAGRADAAGRLRGTSDVASVLPEADIVVEAVPENMALKQKLFAMFDAHAKDTALLASNTSSLSITEIASATKTPERVIGTHFFNPVPVMKLLELVRGEFTSDETVARARALGDTLQKECIVVNDRPGFATSRLGIALGNEAMRMFEEGVASAEDIDKAMVLGYRHPIGPLALTDLVGLDVRLAITEHLHREIGSDVFRPPQILRRMVRAGKLGRKTGQGFYTY